MRKIISTAIFISLMNVSVNAQTFSNNTSASIPDNNSMLDIPVTVSGLAASINSDFGLTKVCLTLNHPFIGQMIAVLKAPTGNDSIRLMWHDGGNSAFNGNLCFTEAAT